MALSRFLKYAGVAALTFYFTYTYYDPVNRFVNKVRYIGVKTETGFVEKDHAFNLRLRLEKNRKGNLETYLLNFSEAMPVYSRNNNLLIGTSQQVFDGLTQQEKRTLCSRMLRR